MRSARVESTAVPGGSFVAHAGVESRRWFSRDRAERWVRRGTRVLCKSLFESLDFVYMPSRDVAGDLVRFTDALGAKFVFAIEAFGTRVAMVNLTEHPPAVLIAGHLEGAEPVLVYRVLDLEREIGELARRDVEIVRRFEIPHGPGVELLIGGPQRIALYELARPEAPGRLAGRRDF
jgi:hypothetical protein